MPAAEELPAAEQTAAGKTCSIFLWATSLDALERHLDAMPGGGDRPQCHPVLDTES